MIETWNVRSRFPLPLWRADGLRAVAAGVALGVLSSIGVSVPAAYAQDVPVVALDEVETESSRGFTDVAGVRELPDGRVILVDRSERFVYALDRGLSEVRRVSRHGQGPNEYEMPRSIHRLDGGRLAVYDGAQARFLILDADGVPDGVLRAAALVGAEIVDTAGALYRRGLAVAPGDGERAITDSAPIERRRADANASDTVAFVPVPMDPDRGLVGGRPGPVMASERTRFRPVPIWTVAPDGTVAIVHPDPYRVEFVEAGGARQLGPPVPYDPIPVTEAHKEVWRERVQRPRPVKLVPTARGRRLGVVTESRIEMMSLPYTEPEEWAENFPPFLGGAARFAPDGTLWVERTRDMGEDVPFDVFARNGERIRRVELPAGLRLVGFGEESVYAVRRDAMDLEYLQRIPMK